PRDGAFIDLLFYSRPGEKRKPGDRREWRYAAFVVRPGQKIERVDLGEAQPINTAVVNFRREVLENKPGPAVEVLRRLVWEPLEKHVGADTRTVWLSPDYALTLVPWGALPGKKPASVLLEDYQLAVVPSGVFLLDRLTPDDTHKPPRDLLLTVGGVDY